MTLEDALRNVECDICPACGAEIHPRAFGRHASSFRCYVRSGRFRRDGWVQDTGDVGWQLLKAWPAKHARRASSFVRLSDGTVRFMGHTQMYLRSPRTDIHLDVLLRAIRAFAVTRRVTQAVALRGMLAATSDEVRRWALSLAAERIGPRPELNRA